MGLEKHFLVFLRVAVFHRFYCICLGPSLKNIYMFAVLLHNNFSLGR